MCPRISASDLTKLLDNEPKRIMIIDLRSNLEFKRAHIADSLNIPFTSVQLGDERLETLNVPDLENQLHNKIVIVISTLHDNSIMVCINYNSILFLYITIWFFYLVFKIFGRLWHCSSLYTTQWI